VLRGNIRQKPADRGALTRHRCLHLRCEVETMLLLWTPSTSQRCRFSAYRVQLP
jgi:hypothetical protein